MLAKNVNDNAGKLDERGALRFFASKLAPTGCWCQSRANGALKALINLLITTTVV